MFVVSIQQVSLALGLDVGVWGALLEGRTVPHASSGSLGSLGGMTRRCGVCFAAFPSAWLLERHALLQHMGHPANDKPFTCEQCGQRYRYRSAYVKHREQNHRARLPADKLFTCDVCGMQFRYLKSFKKHRLNHALERLHRVPESQNGAGSVERSDQVSSTGEPSQPEVASEACPTDPEDQQRANSAESRAEPEELPLCLAENEGVDRKRSEDASDADAGGSATDAEAPTRETTTMGETEDPAAATDEDPVDVGDTMLVEYARERDSSERRERRFACPFCGKCVRSKENLKLHVRKHTGERPFVCLFCGRAFGGKSDLTRHLRIHTGERPYHCEMCGKCFARADYLSKHLTTHIHQR